MAKLHGWVQGDRGAVSRCAQRNIRSVLETTKGRICTIVTPDGYYRISVAESPTGTSWLDLAQGYLPGHEDPTRSATGKPARKKRQKRIKVPILFTPDELIANLMVDHESEAI